ncbi:MAG TPA: RsmE family RNA methyltransferase [Candidatus Eisenbacteria bacterium]
MTRESRRPDTPFWVEARAVHGDRLTLDPDESHHLLHVFRAVPGTRFEATDGEGGLYLCRLEAADRDRAVGVIESRVEGAGELAFAIHLLVGLPDAGPAEAIVEHAVPLGVACVDLAVAARSGRPPLEEKRLLRLNRIARAALKQSRRTRMPLIRSSPSLEAGVAALPYGQIRLVAQAEGGRIERPPGGVQGVVALAVGPPGGFIEWELGVLRGAEFRPISLGPSRLTTETAAISLLSTTRNALL